jgi:hypothetical protein
VPWIKQSVVKINIVSIKLHRPENILGIIRSMMHIDGYNSYRYMNVIETVKLNIEYGLLLQKAKLSSNSIERENNTTDHIYFVICNSCY